MELEDHRKNFKRRIDGISLMHQLKLKWISLKLKMTFKKSITTELNLKGNYLVLYDLDGNVGASMNVEKNGKFRLIIQHPDIKKEKITNESQEVIHALENVF